MTENLGSFSIDYKEVEKKYDKFNDEIRNAFGEDYVDSFKTLTDLDFEQLIAKFKIAGVDFLEVNNLRKYALAKHENYIQYPERRYAIVQDEKGKVRFYEINFTTGDFNHAEEINQAEFENFSIPTYLKDNDVTKSGVGKDAFPRELSDYNTKEKEKQKLDHDPLDKQMKKIKADEDDNETTKKNADDIEVPKAVTHLYEEDSEVSKKIGKIFESGYTGSVGNIGSPSDLEEETADELETTIPKEVLDSAYEAYRNDLSFKDIVATILDDYENRRWFQQYYKGNEFDLRQELEEILPIYDDSDEDDLDLDESHPGNDQITGYVEDNAMEVGKNSDGTSNFEMKYKGQVIKGKSKQELLDQISGI